MTSDDGPGSKVLFFPRPEELTKAAKAVAVANRLLGSWPWFAVARVEVQQGCVYVLVLTTHYDDHVRACVPWTIEGVGAAVRPFVKARAHGA